MGILLIESSSKKIEFGFANECEFIIKEELDKSNNADTLTYFIKSKFEENKIALTEIKYVSLSNGPGSFTGLRIGSAIAKGICFALQCNLIEVPTLDIIANKYKMEFSETGKNYGKEIISMIFSNTRSLEFYWCRYSVESGELKRVSDYNTGSLESIMKEDCILIINENVNDGIETDAAGKFKDVSGSSNLDSQLNLTREYIKENSFTDYVMSEPFYMKEFVPV